MPPGQKDRTRDPPVAGLDQLRPGGDHRTLLQGRDRRDLTAAANHPDVAAWPVDAGRRQDRERSSSDGGMHAGIAGDSTEAIAPDEVDVDLAKLGLRGILAGRRPDQDAVRSHTQHGTDMQGRVRDRPPIDGEDTGAVPVGDMDESAVRRPGRGAVEQVEPVVVVLSQDA